MMYWWISAKNIKDVDVDVFMCRSFTLNIFWPITPNDLQYRFLRQEYSWDRLLITKDTFANIRKSYNAFPALNDHVSSFTFKTSDCDKHFATCDNKVHFSKSQDQTGRVYHGTWTSHQVIVDKAHLGHHRTMLSPSLSSATRAKERLSVLHPPDSNLSTLRSCEENIQIDLRASTGRLR